MSWAAVAVGGATLIGGLVEGNQARQDAKGAQGRAESIEQQKLDLSNKQDARSQQLFDRFMTLYGPAQQKVLETAEKGLYDPNAEATKAIAGVSKAAQQQGQVRVRNAERMGINPNSGRFQALEHQDAIDTAAAEAGAANKARRDSVLANYDVLNQAAQEGNPLIGESSAYSGMAGAGLSDVGRYYEGVEGQNNQLAAGYGQLAGYGLGTIANGLGKYFTKPKQPPGQTGGLISGDLDETPYNNGAMYG